MQTTSRILTGLFCVSLFLPVSAQAQYQTYNLGFKAGIMFPGEVYINPPDAYLYTESGLMFNAYADYLVSPRFSAGLFFLHAGVTDEDFGEKANVNTFGLTLKARIDLSGGFQIRPGLAIGYQLISGEFFEDVEGVDIGFIIGIVRPMPFGAALAGEIGFITQAAGGNEDADVTFGPIFYLGVGLEIGK